MTRDGLVELELACKADGVASLDSVTAEMIAMAGLVLTGCNSRSAPAQRSLGPG